MAPYKPDIYQAEPKPYQPYKPEPEPSYYENENQYKHFPVVEAVPAHPPKPRNPTPQPEQYRPESNYRLPKKQEFSNFPYNPYNEFAEQSLDPEREPYKRKILSGGSSDDNLQNFVTPRSKSKQ